ncbi:MAG: DegV family protein [Dehalococcoidales bacterium]|nr:DegV family protein [Dehalococcoidales bacterium]
MVVKIITDSTSDISFDLARELDIEIVPMYVRFGNQLYRDGIDMSSAELMRKLETTSLKLATSQPSPSDLLKVYSKYSENYDGIISIHISSKISGTYESALIAEGMVKGKCKIEVIDSKINSAGLALVVIQASRMAAAGEKIDTITKWVKHIINQTKMLGVFDTMKYLARGGRVNKAIANIGAFLNIKPLLTFKDGEIIRAGMVRTFPRGIERLYQFVAKRNNIEELAIAHSAIPEIAEEFKERLGNIFPVNRIFVMQLGAALGIHGGPGVLLVALIGG